MHASPLVDIKEALIGLTNAITASDTRGMVSAMERLDGLLARHKGALGPRLVHFLEMRSYAKALSYLEGMTDQPRGTCGGATAGA